MELLDNLSVVILVITSLEHSIQNNAKDVNDATFSKCCFRSFNNVSVDVDVDADADVGADADVDDADDDVDDDVAVEEDKGGGGGNV